jgi:poly-gamma-glutamate synthesis protein (capsule biosynthesis protein)
VDTKNKIIAISAALLAVSQAGLLYFLSAHPAGAPVRVEADKPAPPAVVSARLEKPEQRNPDELIRGGIVPHHLMVRDQLAAYFKAFQGANYETVVIIGPNHFSRGEKIITSDANRTTASGELLADTDLIGALGVEVQNAPFASEHSIGNLVNFVKEVLPQAKYVPIILRTDVTPDEAADLARRLAKAAATKKLLVLASVDFSHYQPVAAADLHDLASRAAIEHFDLSRVYGLEIDSPPSIYALLKYLSSVGAEKSLLKFATNSGRLAPATADNTTSHNFYYFYPGSAKEEKYFSGLFFGDLMLDRHVGELVTRAGVDGLMKPVAGEEQRFLYGTDITMANLEGAVTDGGTHYPPANGNDFAFSPQVVGQFKDYSFNFFNIANNHLADQGQRGLAETDKNLAALGYGFSGCADRQVGDCSNRIMRFGSTTVAMLGFSMVYGDLDLKKVEAKVVEAKKQADFVVINIHWGSEYTHQFSKKQQAVGHALIDAGADAVIGHHPHVVQGAEAYRGKPIFYSLGNFIFDQYFSRDTQEGLAVGLFMENGTTTAHLFPLKQKRSAPELMKGQEKEEFLEQLSGWSAGDEDFAKRLISGVFEIKQ